MELATTKPTVVLADEILDFDEVLRYMDPVLADRAAHLAGFGAPPQRVLDYYVELHRGRYGEEFVQGTLVSLW